MAAVVLLKLCSFILQDRVSPSHYKLQKTELKHMSLIFLLSQLWKVMHN